MTDIKNIFKLTFKRFGIWILLLSVFITATIALSQKAELDERLDNFKHYTYEMALDIGDDFNALETNVNDAYMKKASEIADKFVEKYDLASYIKAAEESEYAIDEYFEEDSRDRDEFWARAGLYDSWSWYGREISIWQEDNQEESYDSAIDRFITKLSFPTVIFIIILGVLMTSLEQSLSYYDFTMMYPWKKKDEVWMKAIVLFVMGVGLLFINIVIGISILKSSEIGSLVSFNGIGESLARTLLGLLAGSIITIATGMIAGNFIGHGGLLVIAACGIDLINMLLTIVVDPFSNTLSTEISNNFENFVRNTSSFFLPFVSVFRMDNSLMSYIGLIVMGLIWAVLAYAVNSRTSAEKSGYMIISRPVEIITKLIATLSLGSIIYIIIGSTFLSGTYSLLNILVFILGLLISKKLFDILFKVRLKF